MEEQGAAKTLTRGAGVDEERSDPGCICNRVQEGVGDAFRLISAEERPPAAPPSAGNQLAAPLNHEVGPVLEELGINAKDVGDQAFNLGGCVVPSAELLGGQRNERIQRWDFGKQGGSNHIHWGVAFKRDWSTRSNDLRFCCGGLRRPPPSSQTYPAAGRRAQAPVSSKRGLGCLLRRRGGGPNEPSSGTRESTLDPKDDDQRRSRKPSEADERIDCLVGGTAGPTGHAIG